MRHAVSMTPAACLLAAAMTACALGWPTGPAAAQQTSIVGDWTGLWDGASNGFVEYRITRASRQSLTVDYGYRSQNGATVYQPLTCKATAPGEYNCGASSLTITSPSSIDAVMHAKNGHTATATLSR